MHHTLGVCPLLLIFFCSCQTDKISWLKLREGGTCKPPVCSGQKITSEVIFWVQFSGGIIWTPVPQKIKPTAYLP